MARRPHSFSGCSNPFTREEIESVRRGQSFRNDLRPSLSPAMIGVAREAPTSRSDLPRYTLERRGNCTIIWLGGGEDRTTVATFRDHTGRHRH